MGNIRLFYDLNTDLGIKIRNADNGFNLVSCRMFTLTAQQEVWWNSNEDVFAPFWSPKLKLLFALIMFVVFIISFRAIVNILPENFHWKMTCSQKFSGKLFYFKAMNW